MRRQKVSMGSPWQAAFPFWHALASGPWPPPPHAPPASTPHALNQFNRRTLTSTGAPPASAGSRQSAASSSGPRCRRRCGVLQVARAWAQHLGMPAAEAAPIAGWPARLAARLQGYPHCGAAPHCPALPPQFAPSRPPYCMDAELPSSTSGSGCASPASSVASQRRPASASRRALEGSGVAAALRQDAVPMGGSGGSFSGGYGATPQRGAGAVERPSTAPAQRQYPWSWQT